MKRYLFAAAGVAALLISSQAFAATEALASAETTDLDAVVVTGEKAQRSVQDTVTSVAVVTSKKIEQENIQNFFDIVRRTANVADTYGGSGFTIRGISNSSITGGGTGGLATVYVDGAAVPDRALSSGPLDMWDVGQVEILRGPQSTLQGRNTLAGAVIVNSQDPTWVYSARGRALVSDAGDRSLAVAVSGPIIEDELAFRLSAEDRHADGFIYNTTRKEDAGAVDALTIRGKLLYTPKAIPGLSIRGVWTHNKYDGGYVYTYARTDVPNMYKDRITTNDDPDSSKSTNDIVTVRADYDINERFKVSSITSWGRFDNYSTYDTDAGPTRVSYGIQDETTTTLSQELRLSYTDDRLEGLFGVYYSDRKVDYLSASLANVTTPAATLQALLQGPLFGNLDSATAAYAAGLYAAALPTIAVDFYGTSPEKIETIALFGDGRYKLTDRFSILAGFRYDREEHTLTTDQRATFVGTLPDPTGYGALAPIIGGLNQVVLGFVAQANASSPAETRKFEAFLPKLGVKYDFNDDLSASFVVQRGYRSGGSTVNIARSRVAAYDPEFTWNYEASLRSSWLDGDLTVNANAFYIDWKDQQVNVFLGLNAYDFETINAGKSHLYGFEVETNYKVSSQFDWYASVGNTFTRFDEFVLPAGNADLSGRQFSYAPRWTLSAGANLRFGDGFVANVNANYRGRVFTDATANQTSGIVKSRTVVNAKFGYEAKHWSLSAYANNLLDEEYVQYDQPSLSRAVLGDPRVVGLILETRW